MNSSPSYRWLATGASILAVYLSVGIAEGNYGVAGVFAAALALIIVGRNTSPRLEAWPLVIAVAGYVLGNRSFAQISLSGNFPVLPAEAALACCLVVMAYRGARGGTTGIEMKPVNLAVIAWIGLGSARIWTDFQQHGFMALRDFATVYYALFFFLAQSLAAHPPSLRLLKRTILGALALLPVVFLTLSHHRAGPLIPEWALVFYKDDIVAALLVAGVFLSFTVLHERKWLQLGALASLQAILLSIQSSRAAIVALGVSSVWWCLARNWNYIRAQGALAICGLLVLITLSAVSPEKGSGDRLDEITRRIVSIADISGRTTYENEEHGYLSDNNRFRMIWWRQVAKEVFETSPVIGLGFGYDLSRGFVRAYDQDFGENFSARSPHSILFTALGRMGLVGLIAWLAIALSMAFATFRAIRNPGWEGIEALGWWSATWALMVSSCFGVVLEGPMGAVPFWTLLGIAVRMSRAPKTPTA